jgi:hypothetical protein
MSLPPHADQPFPADRDAIPPRAVPRVVIVACARWETQYITEWLRYHRSIGFDHVYLYCNDDDPLHLYGAVLPFLQCDPPFVSFVHFPFQGQQFYMYMHFLRHRKHEADWIGFLDIDEFLSLPGVDNIKAYLAGCPPEWDAIHFNWSVFGNNFHAERPPGSVLTTYTRREAPLHQSTKTLTRSACIDAARIDRKHYIWHEWGDLLLPGATAVNVLGEPMARVMGGDYGKAYVQPPEIQERIRARAVVNHYAFKSERDFQHRFDRGLLGDFAGQEGWKREIDTGQAAATLARLNAVEDSRLADYWRRFLADATVNAAVPPAERENVALGKPALQSSVSEWSHGADVAADAAGAVNGRITGAYQFHTDRETAPWWRVDLLALHHLTEIRLFNRVDQPHFRQRLGQFRVDVSLDGTDWTAIYTGDGGNVGGADGDPLILRPNGGLPARYVRITALQPTVLHLDQVGVYGTALGPVPRSAEAPPEMSLDTPPETSPRQPGWDGLDDLIALLDDRLQAGAAQPLAAQPSAAQPSAAQPPAARPQAAQPAAPMPFAPAPGPVIHVVPKGRFANRMIQYMAALKLAALVPGCRIANVDLPGWGISLPPIDIDGPSVRWTEAQRLDLETLAGRMNSGEIRRLRYEGYGQRLENFPDRATCTAAFQAPAPGHRGVGYGADHLLCHVRADDLLLAEHAGYVLTPVAFYQEIVARTGLQPVFMGETDPSLYMARLRAALPQAQVLPKGDIVRDFEIIRQSKNIVVSCSTFAWLAAWLSDAERIILPVNGMLNPRQAYGADLLPLDDPRYRFHLFPVNYAALEAGYAERHDAIAGLWREIPAANLRQLIQQTPRFPRRIEDFLPLFDEDFYCANYPTVRGAMADGWLKSGLEHFTRWGFADGWKAFPFDYSWYATRYPLAAFEVAQGDYLDLMHHYIDVGRQRGYRPTPVSGPPPSGRSE